MFNAAGADTARAVVESQSGAAAAASRCRRFKVKERRSAMPPTPQGSP
jgi:hypothetical protein